MQKKVCGCGIRFSGAGDLCATCRRGAGVCRHGHLLAEVGLNSEGRCRECSNQRARQYERRPEVRARKNKLNRQRAAEKRSTPCQACGEFHRPRAKDDLAVLIDAIVSADLGTSEAHSLVHLAVLPALKRLRRSSR